MSQASKANVPKDNVPGTALVFEGGGYRAAYTAGFARVLMEQGLVFPYVCGLSAGAMHAVDYVSGDLGRMRRSFLGREGAEKAGGLGTFVQGKGYFNSAYLFEGRVDDGFIPFD